MNGGAVELRLIGPMRVVRDGVDVALPASRKTRALLAYLAMARRPIRRDYLCELLWDVPDDPRGGLRWSLSKIRSLVDQDGAGRLVADRDAVRLETHGLSIDVDRLLAIKADAALVPLERLRGVADLAAGFVEGLDLPRCERFQAWLLAMREDVLACRIALLSALATRSEDSEEAIGAARLWIEASPFDADARMALVGLLDRSGRQVEAEGQRRLAIEKLEEGGVGVPMPLRRSPATALAPAPLAAVSAPPREPKREQHVRFCAASDGTGLAWSRVGAGPPLVKTANWLNHLEYDWDSPVWRHWIEVLAATHSLIRYDERGNGLSDWNTPTMSLDSFVDDMASVVEAAGLESFDLLGVSQGCAVAVAYAVRNPSRVRRLVLYGGYAAGWRARDEAAEVARRTAMLTLIREGWGQNNPAFRQVYTTLFFPDASPAEMDWFNELQRMTTSPRNAELLSLAFADLDVRDMLANVSVPTLVLHAREDAVVPFDAGKSLAAGIPGAQFVGLESRNHLLLQAEPAWRRFVSNVEAFLA